MMTLHRGERRRRVQSGMHVMWRSFEPLPPATVATNALGLVTAFDDIRLAPDESFLPLVYTLADVVTYVYQGALAQYDVNGNSQVLQAGEFQTLNTKPAARLQHSNASSSHWTHYFQIRLLTPTTAPATSSNKRFAAAQRRNVLCLVAATDGFDDSLCLHSDARIYSSVLDPGQHLVHAITHGRSAFLHIISGEVIVLDNVLMTGDGMSVSDEPSVSLISQEPSEILLLDVGPNPARRDER